MMEIGLRRPQSRRYPAAMQGHTEPTAEEIRALRLRYVENEIKYFEEFFKVTLGVATFGGTITFTLILTEIRKPLSMTRSTVQTLLAVSWLLFIAALGVAAVSASLLNYYGARIKQEFREDNGQRKWLLVDEMVCIALAVCLLGAFLVASVVVMAYVMAVGIMGVVFTFSVGVVWVVFW
jgi:hypothetical protein